MTVADTERQIGTPSRQKNVAGGQVLVAVPTLNEAVHIEACIRSLLAGDDRLADIKLVVADGGSTDSTCKIVQALQTEFPNLHLIHNSKKLQSAAVNLVAREQRSDGHIYLIRCDAHAAYPPGYIMAVADRLAAKKTGSLVVCMDSVGGDTCFQRANAWVVDTPIGSGGSAHRAGAKSGFVDHGHHAGFDLAAFTSVGGYDETFSHNEDAELDHRLVAAGERIWLDADIRLDYHPRSDAKSLAKQYVSYGKGRARTLLKHRKVPKLRQLAPVAVFLGSIVSVLLAPLVPWVLVAPAAYLSLLVGTSAWGLVAMRSACGLLAGPAAGIMHMAWATGFLRQLIKR
ncbi:MAG: glycosyltransferase family 2 protein [Pseudomonadota bacterium]